MKLRILDNALRLRLSRPEIERLVAGRPVQAELHFPGSQNLRFGVYPATVPAVAATFDTHEITVQLPVSDAQRFARDDVTTLNAQVGSTTPMLKIKIEKDFQCLTPRDEDESALFPHPTDAPRC